jgi:DNA polymerase III subunit epsilon
MIVLGIDLEGVNLDISGGPQLGDRITEIGAVLWDWEEKLPLKIYSELIDEPGRPIICEELVEINGISDGLLTKWGSKLIAEELTTLSTLINQADIIMAHNGTSYDYPMLKMCYARYGMHLPPKVWVDSCWDIQYPRRIKSKALSSLEHSHGFINPFPHRAVTDVLSMLRVASNYDLRKALEICHSNSIEVRASWPFPNNKESNFQQRKQRFEEIKTIAKKEKFFWNPDDKVWAKEIRESEKDIFLQTTSLPMNGEITIEYKEIGRPDWVIDYFVSNHQLPDYCCPF